MGGLGESPGHAGLTAVRRAARRGSANCCPAGPSGISRPLGAWAYALGMTIERETAAPGAIFGGLERAEFERLPRELTGYCYRMLGSPFDAEDAVQDTMVRAWREFGRFEGRSSLRTWLHRIATNVCIDMLRKRSRRTVPMDLQPPTRAEGAQIPPPRSERTWVLPVPDAKLADGNADPAEQVVSRETVRLAFVAALQRLTPRQRAALILRDVLQHSAAESAELLGTTVASANSALQRARATVPSIDADDPALVGADPALLEEYVAAFEAYDVPRLTALLRSDAVNSMPPLPAAAHRGERLRRLRAIPPGRPRRLPPVGASGAGDRWQPHHRPALLCVSRAVHVLRLPCRLVTLPGRGAKFRGPCSSNFLTVAYGAHLRTEEVMSPRVVSAAEWVAARRDLETAEEEAVRALGQIASRRREMPAVKIEKDYVFEGPAGKASLLDLFEGRTQLIVQHFMFDPAWDEGCPVCSYQADSVGHLAHLHARKTSYAAVSRAPISKIEPFRQRMGWAFPWYSSQGSDFNYDFHVGARQFCR